MSQAVCFNSTQLTLIMMRLGLHVLALLLQGLGQRGQILASQQALEDGRVWTLDVQRPLLPVLTLELLHAHRSEQLLEAGHKIHVSPAEWGRRLGEAVGKQRRVRNDASPVKNVNTHKIPNNDVIRTTTKVK